MGAGLGPKWYNIYLSMRPVQAKTSGLLKIIYIHSELLISELRTFYIAKILVIYALYLSVHHLSSWPSHPLPRPSSPLPRPSSPLPSPYSPLPSHPNVCRHVLPCDSMFVSL